ncbi:hypothetical protein C5B42_01235 [Candidatus Cerribacteria bacterium 'Amazon FNV 2010 28 9']|uniref:UDP-N-acetyl-alpha-D-muramoyl-L-alanyl-L-glutamate epimerase n=1 Tax=Candidatus Cerribacteria bacterium 'Amazon FNV 2010 28 9' TaxID=2081795 RepID=A0A317JR54_9BACT|nr:MAG: hypothetical protein C5B42_01235 [Candidatus Cerribacteria bacterium 'Amazon FNV 2010 28 9']
MSHSLEELQTKFPLFRYEAYTHVLSPEGLEVSFTFRLGEYVFHPKLFFHGITQGMVNRVDPQEFDDYIFQIGLAEIPSYWKLACSPTIEIVAGPLSQEEIVFWQKLIEKGMGEFFFVNDIAPFSPSFLEKTPNEIPDNAFRQSENLYRDDKENTVLMPVGGGKDSAVTFELLSTLNKEITFFTLGKDLASDTMIAVFEQKKAGTHRIHVDRILDPLMLELNTVGFLNGHTPFSSVVAFVSVFTAKLLGISQVILSNERSANEETGVYHGVNINHQYSKSFEFESDVRSYMRRRWNDAPNYFSLLRPWYEIQIMKVFSLHPEYFSVFRSCNVGKKTNTWCGHCAKCLFVTLLLSAFVSTDQVISIFGKNMLDEPDKVVVLDQLTGEAEMKAFECVGTRRETMAALYHIYVRLRTEGKPLPALIRAYQQRLDDRMDTLEHDMDALLASFDDQNFVPDDYREVLSHALS